MSGDFTKIIVRKEQKALSSGSFVGYGYLVDEEPLAPIPQLLAERQHLGDHVM